MTSAPSTSSNGHGLDGRGAASGSAPLALLAHPSPDLYGSDRQLLETAEALVDAGWVVTVAVPTDGPLVPLLRERHLNVVIDEFPVLRKSLMNAVGVLRLGVSGLWAAARLFRKLRRTRPDALLVNTITIPEWLLAARLARVPVLCHVHEAEHDLPRVVRRALAGQLLLASDIIVNSAAARDVLLDVVPRLRNRITVVYNGVAGPPDPPPQPRHRLPDDPARIALVGRLSPRKGIDVALEAIARLRGQGRDVSIIICGTTFAGYEWYEDRLRVRAAEPDLAGYVTFAGYVHPTWPVLADADVVLVPSRVEPFGNAAVEGLLAARPVVASAVQGLREVIETADIGLLVPPGDSPALADAIAAVLDDPERAARLADAGRQSALIRFSQTQYADQIRAAFARLGVGQLGRA